MNRAERRAQWRDQNRARAASKPSSIALHIEELVLHGFPMQGRHAIGDAMQAELTRMLSSNGLPGFVTSDRIDGGSFHVTPQAKPNAVGSLIAKAVYGGRRR